MDEYEIYEADCKKIKKENISSLKHFYTYMYTIGEIDLEGLNEMKEEIKESKDEWFETVKKYDDPDTNLEDIW